MKFRGASALILDRYANRLMVEGDPAPAGGGSTPPAADGAPPAAGGAAPAAGAAPADPIAPASEPKSLLSDAPVTDGGDPPPPPETEEQKAERLAKETPEEKTAREAKEAEVRAEGLKAYDGLKLPEGMPADQPAFVDFKNTALDLGVEPEKAQALIDTVAPKMKEAIEAPYNLWADTQVKWVDEIKADPAIGGANLERSIAVAARAIDAYGTEAERLEVRKALAFTGAGNNPAIVRWMHRVGSKLGEGAPVNGRSTTADKPSAASQLYPTMNKTG